MAMFYYGIPMTECKKDNIPLLTQWVASDFFHIKPSICLPDSAWHDNYVSITRYVVLLSYYGIHRSKSLAPLVLRHAWPVT